MNSPARWYYALPTQVWAIESSQYQRPPGSQGSALDWTGMLCHMLAFGRASHVGRESYLRATFSRSLPSAELDHDATCLEQNQDGRAQRGLPRADE